VPDDVFAPLADDLNSSGAIAVLHALHKSGRMAELRAALSFLGFSCEQRQLQRRPVNETALEIEMTNAPIKVIVQPLSQAEVEQRIAERAAARAAKNWSESDRIRDELAAMGIVLKDGKGDDGKPVTTWEVAR
jgi:cysteinyl-tRNA synthetase